MAWEIWVPPVLAGIVTAVLAAFATGWKLSGRLGQLETGLDDLRKGLEDAKADRKDIRKEIARGMKNAKDDREALERRTREDIRAVSEAVERLTLALAFRTLSEPREGQGEDRATKSTAQG